MQPQDKNELEENQSSSRTATGLCMPLGVHGTSHFELALLHVAEKLKNLYTKELSL